MNNPDEIDLMIADIIEREAKIHGDWDRQFIDSVSRYRADGGRLSDLQAEHVNRIWDYVT